MGALQLLRQEYPEAFKSSSSSYESDLLRGAEDGMELYQDRHALNNDPQALQAITNEIQLLRQAREDGVGSYFAYRMGALSSLVSEIILPYGIPFNEEEVELSRLMGEDLDDNLSAYSFVPSNTPLVYIRSGTEYIPARRPFYPDDLVLIRTDYDRGDGYDGFLKEAGRVYFERAIEATEDAWHSVLRPHGAEGDIPPSSRVLTYFFVDEIAYLLQTKGSFARAERVYETFDRVNPDLMQVYELVGDLFYEFGTPGAKKRAVREWTISQRSSGPSRRSSAIRLSKHYIDQGEGLLMHAEGPEAGDNDLNDALRSFQLALHYDGANLIAANNISETTARIRDRQERYKTQQRGIDSAAVVIQLAEKSRLREDFGGALTSYNSALILLQNVGDEFRDLRIVAKELTNTINKNMKKVIAEVLATANDRIEDGNASMQQRRYEDATNFYSLVPNVLGVIDAEPGSTNANRIQVLLDKAEAQTAEAKLQLKRAAPRS